MINTLHGKFKQFENLTHKYTQELLVPEYRLKVQDAMLACFGEQLPNFLPHPVLRRLICEKLDQLSDTTDILINDCFCITSKLLLNNDNDTYKNDMLLKKLLPAFHDVVQLHLSENKRAVHNQLKELIRLEKHDPYTMNHYYMDTINKFKQRLTEQKSNNIAAIKISSLTADNDDDKLLFDAISNDDQAVQEMLISIFSYWKVLIKRFTDYATLSLRAGCVFDVCSGIRERLRRIPREQCDFVDENLADDAFVRNQRKQLQQTKDRLEKVDAILSGRSASDIGNETFTNSMQLESDSLMTLDALEKNIFDTSDEDDTDSVSTKRPFDFTIASETITKRKK
jgi:hypothetical protein